MDAVEPGASRTRQRSTVRAAQKERTRLALREAALRDWLDDAIGFFERHHEVLLFADEAFSVESDLEELSPPRRLDRCAAAMPRYLGRYKGRKRQQAQLRLELLIVQVSMFARLWVSGRWPVKRDLVLDVLLGLWAHGLRGDGTPAAPPPVTTRSLS